MISLLCRPVLNTCVGVAARQYDIVPLITLSSEPDHRTPDLSSSTLILTPGLASSEYSKVCLLFRSLVTHNPNSLSLSLSPDLLDLPHLNSVSALGEDQGGRGGAEDDDDDPDEDVGPGAVHRGEAGGGCLSQSLTGG